MESAEPKPERRWTRFLVPRFSLRTLLLLITAIAVVLGNHLREVQKQKDAVAWIKKQGGSVSYECHYYAATTKTMKESYGWEPEFLRNLLGIDFFYHVVVVSLPPKARVSDLSPLTSLTNLKELWLYTEPISNLSPLASLRNLKLLSLDGTQVNDLSPLRSLTKLEVLELSHTPVSDVSPLASLTKLEDLRLSYSQVCEISPLASLDKLRLLTLTNTNVTEEEIERLELALPKCEIWHDSE